jgi:SET domain-containing protein
MCKTNIFYVDKSKIEGKGLFTKKSLKAGVCAGLLARVYGVDKFNDKPHGIYINHSKDNNLDLSITVDKENEIIYILGIANRDIPANTELTANYYSKYAPTPNFINTKKYPFSELLNK